ncbi:MAG: LysM domain-containing protein [Patescibacteria group bacterium]
MKTLRILAVACFLVVPTFSKGTLSGRVTNKTKLTGKAGDEYKFNKIMIPIKHRVKNGEGFLSIGRRYNVTEEDIRRLNPKLANRKNKNPLLRGESINVPVYRIEMRRDLARELAELKDNELIPMSFVKERSENNEFFIPMSIVELKVMFDETRAVAAQKDLELKQTRESLKMTQFISGTLAVMLLSLMGLIISHEALKKHMKKPMLPQDFIESLQKADGNVLLSVVDMPIVFDEAKNPVTVKKVKEFVDKRPYLKDVPVSGWAVAMASKS